MRNELVGLGLDFGFGLESAHCSSLIHPLGNSELLGM